MNLKKLRITLTLLSLLSTLSLQQDTQDLKISDLSNIFSISKSQNPRLANFTSFLTKPFDTLYLFYGEQFVQKITNPEGTGLKKIEITFNLTESSSIFLTEEGETTIRNSYYHQNNDQIVKGSAGKTALFDRILKYGDPSSSITYGFFMLGTDLCRMIIRGDSEDYYKVILTNIENYTAVSITDKNMVSYVIVFYKTKQSNDIQSLAFLADIDPPGGEPTPLIVENDDNLGNLVKGDRIKFKYIMDFNDENPRFEVLEIKDNNSKVENSLCTVILEEMKLKISCDDPEEYTPEKSYSDYYCDSTKDYIVCTGNIKDSYDQNIEIFLKKNGKYKGDGNSILYLGLDHSNLPRIGISEAFQVENYEENGILMISGRNRKAQFIDIFSEIEKDNQGFWRMLFVLTLLILAFVVVGNAFAYSASKKVNFDEEMHEMEMDEIHDAHDAYENADKEGDGNI